MSATGRAMLKLTLVFAELERERTSERTREIDRACDGGLGLWFGGIPPLGYKSNYTPPDKTTLLIDDAGSRRDEVSLPGRTWSSGRLVARIRE